MKRSLPYILALAVFAVAFLILMPQKKAQVVAAAADLPEGHTLTADDLQLVSVDTPPEGAFTDPAQAVGGVLRVDRTSGDIILPEHLGGTSLPELAADERALGLEVTDSAGLAGTLRPGDIVGVTAVIQVGQETYAKAVGEGYRVLYVSPDFQAVDPALLEQSQQDSRYTAPPERQSSGTVILAIPVDAQALTWDFPFVNVPDETELVYALDLLPALDHARNVALSLYLVPEAGQKVRTSGVYLPDLVVTPPPTPTPLPTAAPITQPVSPTLTIQPTPGGQP